jgi:SAM-dependent methyltransferase
MNSPLGLTPYRDFARVYDRLMGRHYIRRWWGWFQPLATDRGWRFSSLADLAGGTGEAAACFRRRKMTMTVVDRSREMLAQARGKLPAARMLQQDILELQLPRPVDLALCIYGGIHYLRSQAEIKKFFRRVHANLQPGGWFCFDFFTASFLKRFYGGGMEIFKENDYVSIWRHQWNAARRRSEIIVESVEKTRAGWRQHRPEFHPHQSFPLATVKRQLRAAGFQDIEVHPLPALEKMPSACRQLMFLARIGKT